MNSLIFQIIGTPIICEPNMIVEAESRADPLKKFLRKNFIYDEIVRLNLN